MGVDERELNRTRRWHPHVFWISDPPQLERCQTKRQTALIAAYALSPIDLIPDFIPIIGYLENVRAPSPNAPPNSPCSSRVHPAVNTMSCCNSAPQLAEEPTADKKQLRRALNASQDAAVMPRCRRKICEKTISNLSGLTVAAGLAFAGPANATPAQSALPGLETVSDYTLA